jgi:hypothetical protein
MAALVPLDLAQIACIALSLDPPMNWRWLCVGMRKVPSELG